MANRKSVNQSSHDSAVGAAGRIYADHGKFVWLNPDGEKNKSWCDRYIDVIAVENQQATSAWVTEIETEDSVSDSEAKSQWKDYDSVYTGRWHLAVPVSHEQVAKTLIQKHAIVHCTVITWQCNEGGTHTFWGLPGI